MNEQWKKRFDDFCRSQYNQGYQGISFPNGAKLTGKWDVDQQWRDYHLPEDFKCLTVLDIGSNLGGFCIEAARRGADDVVGIESSGTTLTGALEVVELWESAEGGFSLPIRYLKDKVENVDWSELPKFDVVLAFSVFQHMRTPRTNLKRIREAMNDGGTLYAEVVVGNCTHKLDTHEHEEPVNSWLPTAETFVATCKDMGFECAATRKGKYEERVFFDLVASPVQTGVD